MHSRQLWVRLSMGLALILTPIAAQSAPPCITKAQIKAAQARGRLLPPNRRALPVRGSIPAPICACTRARPVVPKQAVLPAPAAVPAPLPTDRPSAVIVPSGGDLKALPDQASRPVQAQAPRSNGSITASQQRQALAIGAVALAAGAAVWMASREAQADAKEKSAPSFGQGASSRLGEDNATAHERAVREAIEAAGRQRAARL